MQATKKKSKKWIVALVVVVLVAAAVFALWHFGVIGKKASASASTYTVAAVSRGDISQTITATGTLAAGGTADECAPVALTISSYAVAVGDQVKAGDTIAKLDSASLDSTVMTLQSDIASLDTQLASLTNGHSTTGYVKSAYDGRVKAVLCAAGDDAYGSADNGGALFILSTDGKMKVETALSGTVAQWDTVKCVIGSTTYTGTVESIDAAGNAKVTFTDDGPKIGDTVTVKDSSGNELGSGAAAVNAPVSILSDSAGTISKIYVAENYRVYQNGSLAYLTNIPISDNFAVLSAQRDSDISQLNQAMSLRNSLVLTASQDGIVEALGGAAASGSSSAGAASPTNVALNANDTVLSLYTGGATSLTVNVDELDIGSVSLDQAATVTLDAISGTPFNGKVTAVSVTGSASGGVTTYPVTITLSGSDAASNSFKIGMNASAVITVKESANALRVPLNAVEYDSSKGQSYVWLSPDGSAPAAGSTLDPNTKTYITTGMSDSTYTEVTSGLKEGDQVVIVRTASANSAGNSGNNSGRGLNFMGGGGQTFTQGGGQYPGGNYAGRGQGGG